MSSSFERAVPVVEISRLRKEDDPPRSYIDIVVAHGIPVKELSPIVSEARKKIASDPPRVKPPGFLKLVVVSKASESGAETGSVLIGLASCSQELSAYPNLKELSLKTVRAPAQPPLSKRQAERWALQEPDVWQTLFRPLTPEELPPVPLPSKEIDTIEGYMRIALAEARKALQRGDVCNRSAKWTFMLIIVVALKQRPVGCVAVNPHNGTIMAVVSDERCLLSNLLFLFSVGV